MTKDKKKNKKSKSLYKTVKTAIPKKPVLYSALGVMGLGLAWGASMDKTKRQAMLDKVTSSFSFKGLGKSKTAPAVNKQPDDIAVG